MKKHILLLLFIPLFSFSQTLKINPGKRLDVNDSIEIVLEVDSLLKYYTFEELKSDPIEIYIEKVEVKRKYTGNDNPRFQTFDVIDRLDASSKKITLTQEDPSKLIFRKKIDQSFLDYLKIEDNEALVQFRILMNFPNYRYRSDDEDRTFFNVNTRNNLGFDCYQVGRCDVYFYERINKSVYNNHFSISKTDIKSNLDVVLKEATSDINLVVRENCGSSSNNCSTIFKKS